MSVFDLFARPGNAQLATAASMNRESIASHLEVPVDGAGRSPNTASLVSSGRQRYVLIKAHLGVERSMSP